jgi:hypothetical protein
VTAGFPPALDADHPEIGIVTPLLYVACMPVMLLRTGRSGARCGPSCSPVDTGVGEVLSETPPLPGSTAAGELASRPSDAQGNLRAACLTIHPFGDGKDSFDPLVWAWNPGCWDANLKCHGWAVDLRRLLEHTPSAVLTFPGRLATAPAPVAPLHPPAVEDGPHRTTGTLRVDNPAPKETRFRVYVGETLVGTVPEWVADYLRVVIRAAGQPVTFADAVREVPELSTQSVTRAFNHLSREVRDALEVPDGRKASVRVRPEYL